MRRPRAAPALLVGTALAASLPAMAQEPGSLSGDPRAAWEAVHRVRALEALASDLSDVQAYWARLATSQLSASDAALGVALFELGESRWLSGDIADAREALDSCIRQTAERQRCAELRARIDLEVEAVRAVPVHWTFDDADHGLFHPRAFWERGSIRLGRVGDDGVLLWRTHVDALGNDQLVAGFDRPVPPPARVSLTVRAQSRDARLEVVVEDDLGHQYPLTRPALRLPQGETVRVTLPLVDRSGPGPDMPPLDASRLYRLRLVDVTARRGGTGEHVVVLSDLVIE